MTKPSDGPENNPQPLHTDPGNITGHTAGRETRAALLLFLIPDTSPRLMRSILEACGGFAAYFSGSPQGLSAELAGPRQCYFRQRAHFDDLLATRLDYLEREGIHLVSLACDTYPALLREIHNPPALLYVKGDVETLSLPQIAIVGSRRASRWGIGQAESFAAALARGGFSITSGLALGVDGAAHRGALRAGKTVAVLGCGVDVVYPRHHCRLYDDIIAGGGAIVSELPPGSRPLRPHFPQRNRIISGLSMGILIVEAASRSGSLITARLAMEQGREVFAIPGSIHNPLARGCHQLIRQGAVLTETLDDIVGQLGGFLSFKLEEAGDSSPELPTDPAERKVLEALGYQPVDVDALQRATGLDTAALTVALVNLEIAGFIEIAGSGYQRIN